MGKLLTIISKGTQGEWLHDEWLHCIQHWGKHPKKCKNKAKGRLKVAQSRVCALQ